jgi:hypothetical protein
MTTSPFTQALQAEVAALQTAHPILAGALDRAFALVADGAVYPLEDGKSAHVRSQSDPTLSHLVNGTCDCKATQYHAAPCAHRLALRLYQRTAARLTVDEEERWESVEAPEATPPTPAPLPEAPCSVNVHVTISGRQVQLTLRGVSEDEVLSRLARVLAQYPLPQPQPQPQRSPQQHNAAAMHRKVTDFCPVYNVGMQQNEKNGRTWYSHYDETAGRWCKGR